MKWALRAGMILTALGVANLLLYEGWAVGKDRADIWAITDYLRAFIFDAPAVAVLLVFLIGVALGALIIHLWNQ